MYVGGVVVGCTQVMLYALYMHPGLTQRMMRVRSDTLGPAQTQSLPLYILYLVISLNAMCYMSHSLRNPD